MYQVYAQNYRETYSGLHIILLSYRKYVKIIDIP